MHEIATTALLAGAIYHLLFGGFHLLFPFALRWSESLTGVDRTNRNLLFVFNLWIAYAIWAWSFLSFAYPQEILASPLGRGLCGTIAGVWTFRYLMQVYYMGFGGRYQLPRKFLGIGSIPGPVFVPIFGFGIVTYLIPVLRNDVSAWLGVAAAAAFAMGATYLVHLRHFGTARRQNAVPVLARA
jgi:hypothetical protein